MKAITYRCYGGPEVLALEDVEEPEVGPSDVRIRIRAASANPRDWHYLRGLPYVMRLQFALRRPRAAGLGSDVAGVVEAVGEDVTRFQVGDEVIADVVTGAFAELVAVSADLVARKPTNLTFEQAAAVPLAALTALQGLRDRAAIQAGQRVLVIGASGGVGTFAVPIAKHLGADVTGVCSTRNVDLVLGLGADRVVDYTRDDLVRGDAPYDVVFQLAGTRSPSDLRRVLDVHGVLLVSSGESDGRWFGPLDRIAHAVALSRVVSQDLLPFEAKRSADDLQVVTDLIEAGTLTPVIDRCYALTDVPEAIHHLETGHARGKVVISV